MQDSLQRPSLHESSHTADAADDGVRYVEGENADVTGTQTRAKPGGSGIIASATSTTLSSANTVVDKALEMIGGGLEELATPQVTPTKTFLPFRVARSETARSVLAALLQLAIYLAIFIPIMAVLEEDWTAIDAAYFSMATMSTVGYGDLSPSGTGTRVIAIVMIFFGIIFVFASVAGLISMITAPITAHGRDLLERAFPQIGVDLNGDGTFDFYKLRPPPVYYAKNLLPSIALTLCVQLLSAGIFVWINEVDFGVAFYHCVVTATTVGYGDVPNPTQSGRLWACFHILISVALLGELISTFDELRAKRAKTLSRMRMLTTRLNEQMLDNMMQHAVDLRPKVQRDGLGLTELEFVLAMMIELEVIELGQVQPFIKQFRLLDADGNARLGRDDLMATKDKSLEELQTQANKRLNLSRQMSVGDRMVT